MDVVAFVPPAFLGHLHVVVGDTNRLFIATEWVSLAELIRSEPVDVIIVDPQDGAMVRTEEVASLLRLFPSLPVVVYTSLSPAVTKALVDLAKQGLENVVLRGFDDDARRFKALLERLPEYEISDRLLELLADALELVPLAMRRVVLRLVAAPHEYHDVQDLAMSMGVTRRTFDRWMQRAGMSSKSLVKVARTVRAYHLMRDPGYRLDDVARKVGYSQARLFTRHVKQVTGMVPSALRKHLAPDEFVALLAARLRQVDAEA